MADFSDASCEPSGAGGDGGSCRRVSNRLETARTHNAGSNIDEDGACNATSMRPDIKPQEMRASPLMWVVEYAGASALKRANFDIVQLFLLLHGLCSTWNLSETFRSAWNPVRWA